MDHGLTDTRAAPLARWADRFAAGSDEARLREVPFLAHVNLRADPSGPAAGRLVRTLGAHLPIEPNTVASTDEYELLWLGPDEWLVVGSERAAGDTIARLAGAFEAEAASIVDVSAQRTVIEVAGARSRDLLAKGCSLDLHPRAFGPGQCAQTLLARAGVIILPRVAAEPTYWVLVRATFAEYLAEWLLDARAEYVQPL